MQLEEASAIVTKRVLELPASERRQLIALAGPPASGKSTLAEEVARNIPNACVVPMDGFHLDNRILATRSMLAHKGSPETFDVDGFRHLLIRLQQDEEVIYPLFDRGLDCAIAGAGRIDASIRTIIVEGNYLLLDAPSWRKLRSLWDLSVYLSVSQQILRQRLMKRWRDHGFSEADAATKVDKNDLPNALAIGENLIKPDMRL